MPAALVGITTSHIMPANVIVAMAKDFLWHYSGQVYPWREFLLF